jgi:hypothetical protein
MAEVSWGYGTKGQLCHGGTERKGSSTKLKWWNHEVKSKQSNGTNHPFSVIFCSA